MRAIVIVFAGLAIAGCSSPSGDTDVQTQADGTRLVARHGTVVIDGCSLDPWQTETLTSPSARRVLQEVVLLCLVPRVDGSVGPGDASARAALASTITGLRTDGYLVRLGTSFTDETGGRYDGAEEASMLADPMWRSHVTDALGPFVAMSDGVELDLQQLPTTARPSLSALASAVATSLHSKGSTVGVLVPPSTMDPSDLPGGDAFDVTTLATMVDRIRVMTLDYSDQTPGPTIDPGWAVSAAKLAIGKAGTTHVDVAYPLYGVDFSSSGRRLVTFLEAEGIAATEKVAIGRGPTYAPRFSYDDPNGVAHQVWFDDSASTLVALRAWDPQALPANVGVVFYGLGAEDPSLWQSISEAMP